MWKRKGFALIELLTVISIISLLMAILIPTLSGVRQRARAAVCLSNLRQWGIVYKMYTDEFDGKLPRNYGLFAWYYPIRQYYSDTPELLVCPSAKKPSDTKGKTGGLPFGGTFLSWGRFAPKGLVAWDRHGSYGLNHWAYKPEIQSVEGNGGTESSGGYSYSYSYSGDSNDSSFSFSWSSSSSSSSGSDGSEGIPKENIYWDTAYVRNSNNVPLILDSGWLYAYFDADGSPPEDDAIPKVSSINSGNYICMDRHNGGINSVFMDFSVRKVALKELWTLKWHRGFNTAGPWTKAGGVQPDSWPKWLRKYKDY